MNALDLYPFSPKTWYIVIWESTVRVVSEAIVQTVPRV
jgi:hypothetical protein